MGKQGGGKVLRLGPLQKLEGLRRIFTEVSGAEVKPQSIIMALGHQVSVPLRITTAMVEHLSRELAQQELINASIRWGMRTIGPEASYSEAYKVYMDHARDRGLEPVALKTFKNRALSEYGANVAYDAPNIAPLRPYFVARPLFGNEEIAG